jgi:hypothetical protein
MVDKPNYPEDYLDNSLYTVFVITWFAISSWCMLNFLLAIIIGAYAEVKDRIQTCKVEDNFLIDSHSFLRNCLMRQLHGWPSAKALESALRKSVLLNVSEAHLQAWFPLWPRASRMSFIRYYKLLGGDVGEAIIERAKPPPVDASVTELENRIALMLGMTKSTPMMRAFMEPLRGRKSTRSVPSLRGPLSARFELPLSPRNRGMPNGAASRSQVAFVSDARTVAVAEAEPQPAFALGLDATPLQDDGRSHDLQQSKALLASLDLSECWPKFAAEGVGLEALIGLADEELTQLGVTKLGLRSMLRQRAVAMRAGRGQELSVGVAYEPHDSTCRLVVLKN